MGAKTGIEWTDSTWNPFIGCSRVSEGCRHCYAERLAGRFSAKAAGVYAGTTKAVNGLQVWTGKINRAPEETLLKPLHWRAPRRIFVNSMSDLFHENVPDEWLVEVASVMFLAYWHQFQILTKRASGLNRWERACTTAMERFRPLAEQGGISTKDVFRCLDMRRRDKIPWQVPLPNVWLGVSVESQATADERIPLLLQTPAAVRFISAEPLLEAIDLSCLPWPPGFPLGVDDLTDGFDGLRFDDRNAKQHLPHLDWVICGGESGPGARPMHPDWARSLRDQCVSASVPFFFKQWGENWPNEQGNYSISPEQEAKATDEVDYSPIGKKAAGALLDGREWKQFPPHSH